MPLHDWTRVEAGIFHDFHFELIHAIKKALNGGVLPADYYATAEQISAGRGPDVLALHRGDAPGASTATLPRPAATAERHRVRIRQRPGNRIVVRHVSGDRPVAVIEVVSRSNKDTSANLSMFVDKADDFLRAGVHLLVIDLFPPGRRDPSGIHGAIWHRLFRRRVEAIDGAALSFASYESDDYIRAYVRHAAVGDALPDVPLFLAPDARVQVPLEAAYAEAWSCYPEASRERLLA